MRGDSASIVGLTIIALSTVSLPHETLVLWVHWRAFLTLKGVGEIGTINQRSNHPTRKGEECMA